MHGIDFGLSDPQVSEHFVRALTIIDGPVTQLAAQLGETSRIDHSSEIARISAEMPEGPLNIITSMFDALFAAAGTLQQISTLVDLRVSSSPVVYQSLLRTALVGTARAVYVLLPSQAELRTRRAAAVLAQDAFSGLKGLKHYAEFTGLAGVRAPRELVEAFTAQHAALLDLGPASTDTKVVDEMTQAIISALQLASPDDEKGTAILADHARWLWNTYSGLAHGYSWPRTLCGLSGDRRVPGDYPMDLYHVATCTHIALRALLKRAQPGTAGANSPLPL